METMTLSKMMGLSIAMPVLFALSALVLGQALERLYAFWITGTLPSGLWARVRERLEEGDLAGALSACKRGSGLLPQAFANLLSLQDPSTERIIEVFQLYRQRFHLDLSRRLGIFGTASFISPLIGLMGTVLGIMRAFHDLSAVGAGGPAVVAAGISEALVTTAAGIAVAVVSAVLYNYFTLTARRRMAVLDLWVLELALLRSEIRG